MGKISMIMFDLSGTTVYDDTGVRDCLYQAAQEFDLKFRRCKYIYCYLCYAIDRLVLTRS